MSKIEIEILYEDENFVVVNKPAGLMVHPDGRTVEPVLTDWVRDQYPETKGVGENITTDEGSMIKRPGIVHRLDKGTSGALIIAKDKPTYKYFKRQFRQRKVAKQYNAFVYGKITNDRQIIDRAIGRSKSDFRKRSAAKNARGKLREARTIYKKAYASKDASYIEIFPKTGRTHQIRVHMRSVHHPVVCDSLYAEGKECILGFDRLALHARNLRFFLPNTDKRLVSIEAPLPDDFKEALAVLQDK